MLKVKKNAIKLLTICLIIFSGCGVDRPDTNICVFNTGLLYKYCYNLKTDYNGDGTRKKTAKPKVTKYKDMPEMSKAMDKTIGTDAVGFGNLKTYVQQLIEAQ